jgi:hypothetical protein
MRHAAEAEARHMPIKVQPTYTEEDVSRILRESEALQLPGFGQPGHAEGVHELIARGTRRSHVTLAGLRHQILRPDEEEEGKSVNSAFWNCQARAIAQALNRTGTQAALSALANPDCWKVVLRADIAAGGFKCVIYSKLLASMTSAEQVYPVGEADLPVVKITTAGGIVMLLGRTPHDTLYIHTAYPLEAAPGESTATVLFSRPKGLKWTIPI